MKIRNGFVSNSSSSNFIIAFKKYSVCHECGSALEVDGTEKFPHFIKKIKIENEDKEFSDNKVWAVGVDGVLFDLETEWPVTNETSEMVREIEAYRGNTDYVVAYFSLSFHNSEKLNILKELKEKGNINVIFSDNIILYEEPKS